MRCFHTKRKNVSECLRESLFIGQNNSFLLYHFLHLENVIIKNVTSGPILAKFLRLRLLARVMMICQLYQIFTQPNTNSSLSQTQFKLLECHNVHRLKRPLREHSENTQLTCGAYLHLQNSMFYCILTSSKCMDSSICVYVFLFLIAVLESSKWTRLSIFLFMWSL